MIHFFKLLSIWDIYSLVVDGLAIVISAVAVLITLVGLKLAYNALDQWKKEKEWDVINEAKAQVFAIYYTIKTLKLSLPSRFMQFLRSTEESNSMLASQYLQYIANDDLNIDDHISTIASLHEKLRNVNAHRKNGTESKLFEFYDLAFKITTDFQKRKMQDYITVVNLSTKETAPGYIEDANSRLETITTLTKITGEFPKEMDDNLDQLKILFDSFEKTYDLEYIKKAPDLSGAHPH